MTNIDLFLQVPKFLNESVELYDWIWKYGWDNTCGGFWWTNCDPQMFKDTITIVEMLHLSSKLSYMFQSQSRYLVDAQKIWDWIFSFDNGYGLMSESYLMSTGAIPEKCCNATNNNSYTRCHNSRIPGTSYNQGLLMSSAAYLYKRTGDEKYLNVGLRALRAILQNYTTKEGVLVDEPRSYKTYNYQCWVGTDPGGDWYSFNGVFMLHLSYFTELLAETDSLSYYDLTNIKTLVQTTSDSAWRVAAVWPPFTQPDVCNTNGLSRKSTVPKFQWFWGHNNTAQLIPPDPRYFFHKTQLRCFTQNGNDTQIWQGMSNSELNCTWLCGNNTNCSKYLYQTDQSSVPGTDCWIWSYNRTNHMCNLGDTDFNVGIKRPIGNATCAGRCNSKEPQTIDEGVCYCDPDCTKHLDCCLDYADHCTPPEPITCKGLCNAKESRAVPGGGYCWCMPGCNPWYTDNNSDGSCCPDYNEVCTLISMPNCTDARTQGSALNLFLAHLKTESIPLNSDKRNRD